MGLAVSGDHGLRLVGREGIEALAAVAPGVGSAAFLQLLSYMPVPDAAFLADTQAALNGLLAGGYLTMAEAIQRIDDQLSPSNPSPLINAFQAVNVLVALSAVDGARSAIYDYIRQEIACQLGGAGRRPSHPMWPFTAQPVIAALARGTIADLDHVDQTALTIVNISAILSTSQIVTSVAQGSIALIAVVAGFINRTDAMTEFGSYLAGRIAGLPLSEQIDSLDVISSLVGGTVDDLQLSDATELLLAIYAGGAKAAALAELVDIGAAVCFFIVGAMTSGSTTLANGVEVMAALATSGAPAFDNAVANFLGDLLVGGQFTPAAVMSALEAAVADDVLTAQEMVALLQDVLVARLDPTNLPASAALQSAILAEIDALIAAHHVTFAEAVATMAASASGLSGAMLFAIGGEIVAFVGGHAGSEADKRRRHPGGVDQVPSPERRRWACWSASAFGEGRTCRWRRAAALPGSSPPAASRRTAPRSASTTPSSAAASLSVISSRSRRACGPTAASASVPRCSIRSARMALRPMPTSPASLPRPSAPARFRPAR